MGILKENLFSAGSLQTSRTPVLEAFHRLVQEGLVERVLAWDHLQSSRKRAFVESVESVKRFGNAIPFLIFEEDKKAGLG